MYVFPNLLVASDGLVELLDLSQISGASGYGFGHSTGCGCVLKSHMKSIGREGGNAGRWEGRDKGSKERIVVRCLPLWRRRSNIIRDLEYSDGHYKDGRDCLLVSMNSKSHEAVVDQWFKEGLQSLYDMAR